MSEIARGGGREVLRAWFYRSAETYAACFCRGDSLALPLADVLPLVFSHEGEDFEDDVRNEASDESMSIVGRIQNRHIEYPDVCAFHSYQMPPFVFDFGIISAEAIQRLNDKQIPLANLPPKAQPGRTVEVLAALLVDKRMCLFDAGLVKCIRLSGDMLVRA